MISVNIRYKGKELSTVLPKSSNELNADLKKAGIDLPAAEYDLIKFPERGTCLYRCGNERYLLMVKAPKYKEALFGSAGGR